MIMLLAYLIFSMSAASVAYNVKAIIPDIQSITF